MVESVVQVEKPIHPEANSNGLSHWKEVTKQTNVLLSKKLTLESYWARQTRPDGRLLSQCRPLSLTKGSVLRKTTHGSAMLTVGSTRVVVAGLVAQVGRIIVPGGGGDVTVTISSLSSSDSSTATTSSLQSWLERTLQETMDLQQLIISTSHAYSLQIGLQILSEAAGNLRDACLLAALAAIHDASLPETTTIDGANDNKSSNSSKQASILYLKPDCSDRKRMIQLPIIAIPLTLGLWNKKASRHNDGDDAKGSTLEWIVDPTQVELQHGCCGQLTIVVDAVTNRILQSDWASLTAVDPAMLALAMRMVQGRASELKSQFV